MQTLRDDLFPVLVMGWSVIIFFYVWRAIKKGELTGRYGGVTYRENSPITFWFLIFICCAFGVYFFLLGLAYCHLAPHWLIVHMTSGQPQR